MSCLSFWVTVGKGLTIWGCYLGWCLPTEQYLMKCLAIYEFKNDSRLYWCHLAWWQCWHLLSVNFPTYQSAYAWYISWAHLFIILGLDGPQQGRATWCQKAEQAHGTGTELPLLASVNDMFSPAELQSAYKTRLVLPSASWAFWWQDNAHFSNPHEINGLHFWKKLDHNVPVWISDTHSLVNQRWLN